MKESSQLQPSILLELGRRRRQTRVFRNNVGQATYPDGSIVRYGLCTGSSDLIGWTTVRITPEMVGRDVAVFTAIEVKRPGKNPTPDQAKFCEAVRASGGIAGVARSPDDAVNLIDHYTQG